MTKEELAMRKKNVYEMLTFIATAIEIAERAELFVGALGTRVHRLKVYLDSIADADPYYLEQQLNRSIQWQIESIISDFNRMKIKEQFYRIQPLR